MAEAAAGGGGGGGGGGEWEERMSSKYNRVYYFNTITQETTWEMPAALRDQQRDGAGGEEWKDPEEATAATAAGGGGGVGVEGSAQQKKRRRDDHGVFAPPVSGAAVDVVAGGGSAGGTAATVAAAATAVLPVELCNRVRDTAAAIRAAAPPSTVDKWQRTDIQVNAYLQQVYASGQFAKDGQVHKFRDCVDPIEGWHLYSIVRDNNMRYTLEVGLAMGASTVWITQALKDAHADMGQQQQQQQSAAAQPGHVAIDPNQSSQYQSVGVWQVQQAGNGDFLSVMEMPSYRAMPELLNDVLARRRPKFDLIFIDGWHTFDYTLVDFFFADLLLAVNGVIVVDDIRHQSVGATIAYLDANYNHFERVRATPVSTMATYRKVREDSRAWNYHRSF